ncbi:uncharacterized protein LOC101852866 [Aplysia californica]|uniref:Uncharacterized protein LOC101852866 n=1 Tax=Aplysia californica TaxID=6500 RepID=A0ABM1VXI9_APLCA|nr:uncharacterized protein LOC101852866 [Aplysia californica]
MGVTASTSPKGMKEAVPMWIYTAQVSGDNSQDKFAAISPGMYQLGPNTVARQRTGHYDTDAAQWKKGFSSGKHVFEIVFPMAHRGTDACVGVGHLDAPLHAKGKGSLVGGNNKTWGINLRTRRALHNNSIARRYPQTQVYLPDKFYMYLDADSGVLQFGSDLEYYGTAHSVIPRTKPLYPMISATLTGATVTMVYRGEGDPSRVTVIATTPAGPPIQEPAPREDPPMYTDCYAVMPAPMREGTTMSKMTDGGPPPPPPTKVGNQQGGEGRASMLSLKEEKFEPELVVEPIPEEGKEVESKPEEAKKADDSKPEGQPPAEKTDAPAETKENSEESKQAEP